MKCLSVLQPWAWAILHLGKEVENRTWTTSYRGPLLIHTGKGRRWLDDTKLRTAVELMFDANGCTFPKVLDALPFGAVVGVVDLWTVGDGRKDPLPALGWAEPHSFWWRLMGATPFPVPVPMAGRTLLYEVDDTRVLEQLRRVGWVYERTGMIRRPDASLATAAG